MDARPGATHPAKLTGPTGEGGLAQDNLAGHRLLTRKQMDGLVGKGRGPVVPVLNHPSFQEFFLPPLIGQFDLAIYDFWLFYEI